MISWVQVVAFAPELATVNPTVQELLLQYTHESVPEGEFCGADYTLAQIYLAAHLATLHVQTCDAASGGAVTGPVQSESVGGLSTSYKDGYGMGSVLSREGYERTKYGAAFLEIARSSRCGSAGLGVTLL